MQYPAILDQLEKGAPVRLSAVSGGCIADARIAVFADGSRVFVKGAAGLPDMFEREAEGLQALANARALRVPRVLAVDRDALVLECIEQGSTGPGFFETFGRRFARMHRLPGPCCGFAHDNYIGATPQINRPVIKPREPRGQGDGSDWPEFFLERRLRFQVELAAEKGHGHELARLLDACESRLVDLLACAIEPPGILHGDLWSGNVGADSKGNPVIFDPAVYYGDREADLAMTELFGGFGERFFAAYDEVVPIDPGYPVRKTLYNLYHVLNHFNLFGGGYGSQASHMIDRLLSEC